ncbi:MAG: hypothetical protein ACPKOP_03080 [Sphaerochaetaceae bacterium]
MNGDALSFTYEHYNTIYKGDTIVSVISDYADRMKLTKPLWIAGSETRPNKLHRALFDTPFNIITEKTDHLESEDFDFLIVYGGKREIELSDKILTSVSKRIASFHILKGSLEADEYIHGRGINDLVIIDRSLVSKEKKETVAQQLTILLFYLLASVLQTAHPLTRLSMRHVLSEIVAAVEALHSRRNLKEATYRVITLIPLVGEINSNSAHSFIISLMEHMVIDNHSNLYQSAASLIDPLIRFIRETSPSLYAEIQKSTGNTSIEDLSTRILNISPAGPIKEVLQQTIVQIYTVIMEEEEKSSFHQFLTFIDSKEVSS